MLHCNGRDQTIRSDVSQQVPLLTSRLGYWQADVRHAQTNCSSRLSRNITCDGAAKPRTECNGSPGNGTCLDHCVLLWREGPDCVTHPLHQHGEALEDSKAQQAGGHGERGRDACNADRIDCKNQTSLSLIVSLIVHGSLDRACIASSAKYMLRSAFLMPRRSQADPGKDIKTRFSYNLAMHSMPRGLAMLYA